MFSLRRRYPILKVLLPLGLWEGVQIPLNAIFSDVGVLFYLANILEPMSAFSLLPSFNIKEHVSLMSAV